MAVKCIIWAQREKRSNYPRLRVRMRDVSYSNFVHYRQFTNRVFVLRLLRPSNLMSTLYTSVTNVRALVVDLRFTDDRVPRGFFAKTFPRAITFIETLHRRCNNILIIMY